MYNGLYVDEKFWATFFEAKNANSFDSSVTKLLKLYSLFRAFETLVTKEIELSLKSNSFFSVLFFLNFLFLSVSSLMTNFILLSSFMFFYHILFFCEK